MPKPRRTVSSSAASGTVPRSHTTRRRRAARGASRWTRVARPGIRASRTAVRPASAASTVMPITRPGRAPSSPSATRAAAIGPSQRGATASSRSSIAGDSRPTPSRAARAAFRRSASTRPRPATMSSGARPVSVARRWRKARTSASSPASPSSRITLLPDGPAREGGDTAGSVAVSVARVAGSASDAGSSDAGTRAPNRSGLPVPPPSGGPHIRVPRCPAEMPGRPRKTGCGGHDQPTDAGPPASRCDFHVACSGPDPKYRSAAAICPAPAATGVPA
ncbi:hypothetical protein A6302_02875 [Methylobrevis pamukkalensis]|uniref:Uncharacterized protein n=1 Tax=Methylobrevis pamukkalensis TaxID=1439726 RepID=A0A1E3H125_9HYPH|nr:hypothetical protein A6302_02875 [Methylobrevis pamukkalensis]